MLSKELKRIATQVDRRARDVKATIKDIYVHDQITVKVDFQPGNVTLAPS